MSYTYLPGPEIIEYLEGAEWEIAMRRIVCMADGIVTRNMLEVLPDNEAACTDDDCTCYIFPENPLSSISEVRALEDWDKGYDPCLPRDIYDKYYEQYKRTREID